MTLTLTPTTPGDLNLSSPYPLAALDVYNVKDYGAAGNEVTDDRAAIQDLIDDVVAAGGGTIFFPIGVYLIGTPGLVLPTSNQNYLCLRGSGSAGNDGGTQLLRNGAYVLLTAAGTGTSSANIFQDLHIRDITFSGANTAATVLRLDRCAAATLERVKINNSAAKGLHGSQIWNSVFYRLLIEQCGASASHPAMLLDGYAIPGETHTVDIIAPNFEGNQYTDLELDGANASSRASGVKIVGGKMESVEDGNHVHFKQAQFCSVNEVMMLSNAGSNDAPVLQTAGALNQVRGCTIVSDSTAAYLVQLTAGGPFTLGPNSYMGGTTAHIRMDSGMGDVEISPGGHFTLTSEVDISDARTAKTGLLTTRGSRPVVIDARPYSGTISTDAQVCSIATIEATNGTAYTISNPTRPTVGQILTYDIKNSSGGAMGAITWGTGGVFMLAGAFTNPANTKRRTITFYYNGTNWIETNRAAADI